MAPAQDASGLWRRPDQLAHARTQDGIAAYRAKEYDEAIATFAGIDSADGQYNLGNALAKAGRYDEAIAAYDRALRQQPKMADAIANRVAVEAARKRKPPPGKQPQPNGKDSGKQGQQAPQPGGEQGPPQGGGQSPPPRTPSTPAQPPTPAQQQPQPVQSPDARQQAAADAAQRQSINEALRKQHAQRGEPAPARAKPAETAEQRERRVANQAQLQRVPDDPGGLLRARFRLEHERRQGRRP